MCVCVCCGEYALQNVIARETVANCIASIGHLDRQFCFVRQGKQYHTSGSPL